MQNLPLPTEVIDKIIDFKNGDNKYWKSEYNKVMKEILTNDDLNDKRIHTDSINTNLIHLDHRGCSITEHYAILLAVTNLQHTCIRCDIQNIS